MKLKKNWIKNIDEKILDTLINEKSVIEKAPESLQNKVFDYIDNLKIKNTVIKPIKNKSFNTWIAVPALAAIIFILIIIPVLILNINKGNNIGKIDSHANSFSGNTIIIRKGVTKSINKGQKFYPDDIIKTDKDAKININIDEKTNIDVFNNTEVKILELSKLNDNDIMKFYLNKGMVECKVKLPTKKSIFDIHTGLAKISVTGTHFIARVTEKNVDVHVKEGTVELSDYIKNKQPLDDLKKKDKETYEMINKLYNQKIEIKEGESYNLDEAFIQEYNDRINTLIESTSLILKERGLIINKEKSKLKDQINKIKEETETIKKDENNEGKIEEKEDKKNEENEEKIIDVFKVSKLAKIRVYIYRKKIL